jgi:hypothetical protein
MEIDVEKYNNVCNSYRLFLQDIIHHLILPVHNFSSKICSTGSYVLFTVHCQVVKMQVIRTATPLWLWEHNHNDQASIWHMYLGTNFCHVNQLWKQYDIYSLGLLYSAQLLVDLETLPLLRIPH